MWGSDPHAHPWDFLAFSHVCPLHVENGEFQAVSPSPEALGQLRQKPHAHPEPNRLNLRHLLPATKRPCPPRQHSPLNGPPWCPPQPTPSPASIPWGLGGALGLPSTWLLSEPVHRPLVPACPVAGRPQPGSAHPDSSGGLAFLFLPPTSDPAHGARPHRTLALPGTRPLAFGDIPRPRSPQQPHSWLSQLLPEVFLPTHHLLIQNLISSHGE